MRMYRSLCVEDPTLKQAQTRTGSSVSSMLGVSPGCTCHLSSASFAKGHPAWVSPELTNQCFAKNISFAFRFRSVSILFGMPSTRAFCCSVQWVQAMLVIRYFDEITIFEDRNGLSTNQICEESFYLQWYVASHGNMLSNLLVRACCFHCSCTAGMRQAVQQCVLHCALFRARLF